MGELQVLFSTGDDEVYQNLETIGLLGKEMRSYSPWNVEGILLRGIDLKLIRPKSPRKPFGGPYVSLNYRVQTGDFIKGHYQSNPPKPLEEWFGPAPVLGVNYNTAEYHHIVKDLTWILERLEHPLPEIRRRLSFLGILDDQFALLDKEDKREEIKKILWSK